MWATLEQPGVPTGVQKVELCVFTAPAHNKKRPSGKVVIMRSNLIWHKLRMNRACAQKTGTGVSPKRRNVRIRRACAQKQGADRPGRSDALQHNLT